MLKGQAIVANVFRAVFGLGHGPDRHLFNNALFGVCPRHLEQLADGPMRIAWLCVGHFVPELSNEHAQAT